MGRIEADIESWLFRFRPCSVQGQFTLPTLWDRHGCRNGRATWPWLPHSLAKIVIKIFHFS